MYNLELLLKKRGMSKKEYAEFLGVNEKTVQNKLNSKSDFTYPEVTKTCSLLFPEYKTDYVFATNDDLDRTG